MERSGCLYLRRRVSWYKPRRQPDPPRESIAGTVIDSKSPRVGSYSQCGTARQLGLARQRACRDARAEERVLRLRVRPVGPSVFPNGGVKLLVGSMPRISPRSTCRKALGRGYFLAVPCVLSFPLNLWVKRAVAFFDGQNLFHAAKEAFGHRFPNYDPLALARQICDGAVALVQTLFYTGYPDAAQSPRWNHFWTAKMATMGRQGVRVFSRILRYRTESVDCPGGVAFPAVSGTNTCPGGATISHRFGEEKGVDVRLALDVIRLANQKSYDVGVIFSQDQDLTEVADEIRSIAHSSTVDQTRQHALPDAHPPQSRGLIERTGSRSTSPHTPPASTLVTTA